MSNDKQKAPQPGGSMPIPKSRGGIKGFYREVVREMKHVNWPTSRETTRLSGVVLAICVLVTAMLWVLSTSFGWALAQILHGGG